MADSRRELHIRSFGHLNHESQEVTAEANMRCPPISEAKSTCVHVTNSRHSGHFQPFPGFKNSLGLHRLDLLAFQRNAFGAIFWTFSRGVKGRIFPKKHAN